MLDVATGTGVAAFMAAERVGMAGEVVATDISQKMVDSTRAAAAQRGVINMQFERVDAEELGYADGSFDAATCVLGLMYPTDPQRAIEQMHRVLKPGGRLSQSGADEIAADGPRSSRSSTRAWSLTFARCFSSLT